MALTGLMWWIDRWRKSTAYMDMTLEQQGAYRNLLDEAWLRGGALPNDERVLAKACGDVGSWKRVKAAVLARFRLVDGAYRNDTLDEVLRQSTRRVEKQKRYRDKKRQGNGNGGGNDGGNAAGNGRGNGAGNDAGNKPGYLDPDLGRELSTEQESSRRARGRVFTGTRLKVTQAQHALVMAESGLADAALCALYAEWDAELVESNEMFDTLSYVKRRTQEVRERRPATEPDVDWFEECKRLHGGKCGGQFNHHTRMCIDAEKARVVNA